MDSSNNMAAGVPCLPETYDDLPDKQRYWPEPSASEAEGLGMLRLLTPDVVATAAQSEIKTGERACLNWDMSKLESPAFNRLLFSHLIKWVNEPISLDDEYHFNPQQSSQWDGLRHHSAPAPPGSTEQRLWYGGTTAAEILGGQSDRIGMGLWAKQGIAGRGVLIDYQTWAAEKKGIVVDALSQHAVRLEDVLTIAKECNLKFQRGDIFFLRVGLPRTWNALTSAQKQAHRHRNPQVYAGIEQNEQVVRFFWDNHFAAVASDAVGFEVFPAIERDWDLHHYLLAGYGIPIGEMFDLDGLAGLCKKLGRWSFFVSSSPLNYSQGVSSPPNIMAIF